MNASKLSSILDEVEHEPGAGEEIGQALAPVVREINRANAELAGSISRAITEAIGAVDGRPIVVRVNEWTRLEFDVIRDKSGDLKKVVVTRA